MNSKMIDLMCEERKTVKMGYDVAMAAIVDKSIVSDCVEYGKLLANVRWFFETEDALKVVRLRVSQGKATIGTYRDLAIWAGNVESQLRKEVDDGD